MIDQLSAGVFFGRTTQVAHVAHVRLVVSDYKSGLTVPRHSHELAHFCLVLGGSYLETVGKSEQTREPGTLVYQPSGVAHAEHHMSRGRHLLIEPDATWTHRLSGFEVSADASRTFVDGPAVALARRAFGESHRPDSVSPLVIEALMLELFAEAWRPPGGRKLGGVPRWMKDIRELIESDFRRRISLAELAGVAGVHPGHLSRVFRRYYGCCVGDYQRRLRAKYAHRQIVGSDAPLVEIALAAGYADQSHFSRQVILYIGQSPQTLRRTSQG